MADVGTKICERVIIHFGPPKTGSTALQKAFFENKSYLLERGLLYPGREENHYHFQTIFSENPSGLIQVQRDQINTSDLAGFIEYFRTEFEIELREARPHTVVISSEYFIDMNESEIRRMKYYFQSISNKVQAVYYLRDPWSHWISATLQRVKNGELSGDVPLSIREFAPDASNVRAVFSEKTIKNLSSIFASDLIIRNYNGDPRSLFDIQADFLEVVGLLADRDFKNLSERENRSMGYATTAIVAVLNQLFPQFDDYGNFVPSPARDWMLEALLKADPADPAPQLERVILHEIGEFAVTSNKEMVKLYPEYAQKLEEEMLNISESSDGLARISLQHVSQSTLATLMLNAMRILADRAVSYHEWALHEQRQSKACHLPR